MDIQALHEIFLSSSGVCTDTRKIKDGSIFFALKGENFNGNAFAMRAIEAGAAYAVIDEKPNIADERLLQFPNGLQALQDLAHYHRKSLDIPFIAITGSNGKTTTKELMRDVLSKKYNVLATRGNLNNHIGVPLTLLGIDSSTEIAIIEMGANHLKEIEFLCTLAEPDYGLITNIGMAHVGEFGSPENILIAKTELYESIKRNKGKLFVHSSSAKLMEKSKGIERSTYGSSKTDDTLIDLISADPSLMVRWNNMEIKTQLIGSYNLSNVAAAIALGAFFEVPALDISAALEAYTPENNRSQLLDKGTHKVILDAYNANPSSMEAAFKNFMAMKSKRHIYILGEMKELGAESVNYHKAMVQMALASDSDGIFIGQDFCRAAEGTQAHCFTDVHSARNYLAELDLTESLVLLKGSRGTRLELLQDLL